MALLLYYGLQFQKTNPLHLPKYLLYVRFAAIVLSLAFFFVFRRLPIGKTSFIRLDVIQQRRISFYPFPSIYGNNLFPEVVAIYAKYNREL